MLTNVISELVRTLSQPLMTSPGLLVLKKSSKSGLAVASITAPATDASLLRFFICFLIYSFFPVPYEVIDFQMRMSQGQEMFP